MLGEAGRRLVGEGHVFHVLGFVLFGSALGGSVLSFIPTT